MAGTRAELDVPAREAARDYYRQSSRLRPAPEPHERYHIDPQDFPPDCDCVWVAVEIRGQPTQQLRQYVEGGWIPARAIDFPIHSGYGTKYPDPVLRAELIKVTAADDVVKKDGQMLFVRPKELSQRADVDRNRAAQQQLYSQMEKLAIASRRAVRDHTIVKYGQQYANPDALPDFATGRQEV